MKRLLIIPLFTLYLVQAREIFTLRWYPTNSKQFEGISLFFDHDLATAPRVIIEAESDGTKLRTTSGEMTPTESDSGMKNFTIVVPVGDATVYKITKLTLTIGSRTWFLEEPKRMEEIRLP